MNAALVERVYNHGIVHAFANAPHCGVNLVLFGGRRRQRAVTPHWRP